MSPQSGDLTRLPQWLELARHRDALAETETTLASLFAGDSARADRLSVEHEDLLLDYSKNRVSDETLALLVDLARARDLPGRIEAAPSYTGRHPARTSLRRRRFSANGISRVYAA